MRKSELIAAIRERRDPGSVMVGPEEAELGPEESQAIRDWAQRSGQYVSTRGDIPPDVVDEFIRANQPRSS
jgi:hypothetical protein